VAIVYNKIKLSSL